jgi:hypothetical protein
VASQKSFQIEMRREGGRKVMYLAGVIDESADLQPIAQLREPVDLNMREIRRINSFGVRAWIDHIRQIPHEVKLTFVECPPPVIDQCNMVSGFLGHGILQSFYAPMVCEECDEQQSQLFLTEDCRKNGGRLPATPCPRCGRDMEVDDLEEQYLLFVRDPKR